MIEIEKTSFCGLSTSSAWQTWLYNTDGDLYKSFIDRLLTNRGCSDNRKLMEEYYQIIMNNQILAGKFIDFIKSIKRYWFRNNQRIFIGVLKLQIYLKKGCNEDYTLFYKMNQKTINCSISLLK